VGADLAPTPDARRKTAATPMHRHPRKRAPRHLYAVCRRHGGIAAMMLARDLKALGLYAARRFLRGRRFSMLEHKLTLEQVRIYDAMPVRFRSSSESDAALKAVNATSDQARLTARPAAAHSAFESNKQRFFNHSYGYSARP
jgi:hypothetical protein